MRRLFLVPLILSFVSPVLAKCPVGEDLISQVYSHKKNLDEVSNYLIPTYLNLHTQDKLFQYLEHGIATSEFINAHKNYCQGTKETIASATKLRKLAEQLLYLCDATLQSAMNIRDRASQDEQNFSEIYEIHGCSKTSYN